MMNQIGIGIVNYNGGKYLRKCIESALAQKNASVKVFVYDNASTDDSVNSISEIEAVRLIRGSENKGYAFACNRLIEAMDCEIVAVANMDLEFDPFWSEQVCIALNKHPDVDSVASLVLEQGNPTTINFAGIGFLPDLHPQSIYAGMKPEDAPSSSEIIFGSYGAVMVFRRELFSKIGFFDEDYFLFYEETEFFWRMNLYSRKTIFWPTARITHFRSLTTKRFSPLKLFYSERNRIYTGLKILPYNRYFNLFFFSIFRLYLMQKSIDSSQKEKMNQTGASPLRIILTIIKAWLSAIYKFPAILEKRKKLFRQSGSSPEVTIKILNRNLINWSLLSVK